MHTRGRLNSAFTVNAELGLELPPWHMEMVSLAFPFHHEGLSLLVTPLHSLPSLHHTTHPIVNRGSGSTAAFWAAAITATGHQLLGPGGLGSSQARPMQRPMAPLQSMPSVNTSAGPSANNSMSTPNPSCQHPPSWLLPSCSQAQPLPPTAGSLHQQPWSQQPWEAPQHL